jgi:hypothetical protein
LALVVCGLALSACRVTVTGGADVRADGGGTVRAGVGLDAEAAAAIPDLASQLRVDDLRQAGWAVEGPRKEGDGLTWVRASRRFSDAAGAARALNELSGPSGPFQGITVGHQRSFLHAKTTVSGTVDLSKGLAGFVDPDLQRRIGDGLALDPAGLRRRLGSDADRLVQVELLARLPGSIRSNATGRVDGGVVWRPDLGQRLPVQASADKLTLAPLLTLVAAVLVAAMLVVAFVVFRRRRA